MRSAPLKGCGPRLWCLATSAMVTRTPEDIGRTRRYIEDFSAAVKGADSHADLYDTMVALYPDRLNRGVLWNSARAVQG